MSLKYFQLKKQYHSFVQLKVSMAKYPRLLSKTYILNKLSPLLKIKKLNVTKVLIFK
jgi:hypothetical protein